MSDRPAGRRGHAYRLMPLEPRARLTSGLLWWVPPFLLPCMGPMPNHASDHCDTWRVLLGGMSQMFRLLFLGNGWADCVEIWHALGDPLVTAYAVVTGGVSLQVRQARIQDFCQGRAPREWWPYMGWEWAIFDIRKYRFPTFSRCLLPYYAWMVLNNHSRDTSVPCFCPWDEGTRAFGAGPSVPGVGARPSAPLDPRLCARAEIPPALRFCISETAWPIVFKFGMWVGGY